MFQQSFVNGTAATVDEIPSLTHPEYLETQVLSGSSQDSRSNIPTEENRLLRPISQPKHSKSLTWWDGVCLVVCQQIGSGIFSTPALVNKNAGSVGMSLLCWVVAGCIAWSGACTFTENPCADCSLLR